jgi:hypothetical protein
MADTFESNKIPFKYQRISPVTNRSIEQNITLVNVFDKDLKKTFVYKEDKDRLVGLFPTRTLLATIESDGKVIPYQENGSFNADESLRSELQNNQNLKSSLGSAVIEAAKRDINPSNPASVTSQAVDEVLGSKKAATEGTTQEADPQGGNVDPSATDAARAQSLNPVIPDSDNVRKTYGNMVYPIDLDVKTQDYVTFSMFRYKPKTLSGNVLNPFSGSNTGSGKGSVTLPIQAPAADTNTVGWSDGKLNSLQAAGLTAATKAISGDAEGLSSAISTAMEDLQKDQQAGGLNVGQLFRFYAATQAAQINEGFARATGGILNPNLELLFQGPELRNFSFVFKMSARDIDEAMEIRKIIRFFKQGMSVKKSSTQLFLKSPDIFKVTYYRYGGVEHKAINMYKTAALRAFNVDYTPLGSYMTYDDPASTMVAYTMTMQFQEIDPIYDDDYSKLQDDAIGY